jgi:hypothetical protein
VAASVAFSIGFTCATPFAAFAAVAAGTLTRRDTYLLVAAVWLVNQVIGFAFLHYPLAADCFAWGAVLGVTVLLCTLVARQTIVHLPTMQRFAATIAAFLLAFAAYEAALRFASLFLGGRENLTLAIQAKIFALNALALVGLLVLNRAGTALGVACLAPSR